MMLKDEQGRKVLVHRAGYNGSLSFLADVKCSFEAVDEAIICDGNDTFWSHEHITALFEQNGFSDVPFTLETESGDCKVKVNMHADWNTHGFFAIPRQAHYYIDGKQVAEQRYNDLLHLLATFAKFDFKALGLPAQSIFELIGVGKVVTPSSLEAGYAKGENRPRLLAGDSVLIKSKKGTSLGVIRSVAKKVTVMLQDGTSSKYRYDVLERTKEVGHNKDLAQQIEPVLLQNFDYTAKAASKRIYRAALKKDNFVYPVFPTTNQYGKIEHQVRHESIPTCVCPICGWTMADCYNRNVFCCCYCKIEGSVIFKKDTEVALLMNRMPGKNRFNIKESRCCGNCGLFAFEYGRQGKRSTGYCKPSNQCVQGHNVCDMWYPRTINSYESNMKQSVTNLHFGVQDTRNTSRNDIRDTVYTEEDHKLEQKRADRAKVAYAHAMRQFEVDLKKMAEEKPLVTELSTELTAEWTKVLDDPC